MLDPTKVINGSFGEIWMDGEWQSNYNHCEATVEVQKSELKLCGSRWVKHKVTGLKGAGTISGFKVSSKMIMLQKPVADATQAPVRTELIVKLSDPESYGCERIRLKYVLFDKIPLANWEAGQEVKEEIGFTFEDFEALDPIAEG